MSHVPYNPMTTRKGLTLLELVVVLVVLVGLAGIIVPLLPNVLNRTHDSTTASNITAVHRALQLYEGKRLRAPNGWDSLISTGGETFRTDRFTVVDLNDGTPLSDRIIDALNAIGITESWEFNDGIQGNGRPDGHANRPASNARLNTFDDDSVYSGTAFDLTSDGSVVILGPNLNEINRLNLSDPDENPDIEAYVVLGIGARLTALDDTLPSAPVHFPGQGDLDPTQTYARFVAVYAIPASGPARLVRTAAVHNDHLDSLDGLMKSFYEGTN